MSRSQAPLSLEYILLGFLSQGPSHGYDLHKKITALEGIALIWHIKQARLYALLDKLEADGLLHSRMAPGEAHLMRKEFQLSAEGRQAFADWVASPVRHGRDMRQEFPAKLFFAQQAGDQASLKLIELQKQTCTDWLYAMRSGLEKLAGDQRYERMIFQYRILQAQAMLKWLETCAAEFQAEDANLHGE